MILLETFLNIFVSQDFLLNISILCILHVSIYLWYKTTTEFCKGCTSSDFSKILQKSWFSLNASLSFVSLYDSFCIGQKSPSRSFIIIFRPYSIFWSFALPFIILKIQEINSYGKCLCSHTRSAINSIRFKLL